MLRSTRTSSVRPRFNPRLEALEDRALMAVAVNFAGGVLTFTGAAANETLTMNDNGSGTVAFTATGAGSSSFNGVDRIVINLKGGNDTVTYNLNGPLSTARRIDADLGAGNDRFRANLGGQDLLADLDLDIKGAAGNDRVELNQIGRISANDKLSAKVTGNGGEDRVTATMVGDVQGRAEFDVRGGSDSDSFTLNALSDVDVSSNGVLDVRSDDAALNFDYRGELDGRLLLDAIGASGQDTLTADLTLDAGSTGGAGDTGNAAKIDGRGGRDTLRFTVVNNSGSPATATVFAQIDGGTGRDVGTRTTNVTPTSIETDNVV
jgi:hypothetical protein